jgi:hypothetical protein
VNKSAKNATGIGRRRLHNKGLEPWGAGRQRGQGSDHAPALWLNAPAASDQTALSRTRSRGMTVIRQQGDAGARRALPDTRRSSFVTPGFRTGPFPACRGQRIHIEPAIGPLLRAARYGIAMYSRGMQGGEHIELITGERPNAGGREDGLPQQEWKKAGESVACDDRKQRDDKKNMANAVVKCRAFEHDEANGQQGCSPDDQRLPARPSNAFSVRDETTAWLGWEDSNPKMSLYKRLGRTPWFSRIFSYQRIFALPREKSLVGKCCGIQGVCPCAPCA